MKDATSITSYREKIINYIKQSVFVKIPDNQGILPYHLHEILVNALPKHVYKNLNQLVTKDYLKLKRGYSLDEYQHEAIEYFEVQMATKIIIPFCNQENYDFDYAVDFDEYPYKNKKLDGWENFSKSIVYFAKSI